MSPLHGSHPCKSCPFRRDGEGRFEPDTLDQTVGENLRSERYVHKCHQHLDRPVELLCVGFIRHCTEQGVPNQLIRLGQRMGVIDLDAIRRDANLAESWDEVLAMHQWRKGKA